MMADFIEHLSELFVVMHSTLSVQGVVQTAPTDFTQKTSRRRLAAPMGGAR